MKLDFEESVKLILRTHKDKDEVWARHYLKKSLDNTDATEFSHEMYRDILFGEFGIIFAVKIVRNDERFWLIVTEIADGNGKMIGRLDNNLVCQSGKIGDRIEFNANEIIDEIII